MMYAVFFAAGEYEGHYQVLLFVTADKQLAEDSITMAELEYEAAKNVPLPHRYDLCELRQAQRDGTTAQLLAEVDNRVEEYKAKLKSIMTVDNNRYNAYYGIDPNGHYYFEQVEVR